MAFSAQDRYADYGQVPVMRRRWFFVLTVLFFIPLGVVLAISGDVYAYRGGQVVRYPRSMRIGLAVFCTAIVALAIVQMVGI
jgi:hypothetical protein